MVSAKTKLYFVTDVHGSEKCFRKFLNAGPVYQADVMILGGDLAGKELQVIKREPNGKYSFTLRGKKYDLVDDADLESAQQFIADIGYYSYVAEPGEIEELQKTEKLEAFFEVLMRERLLKWLQLADERLRPINKPLYWMLGNDDPNSWAPLLRDAPWGTYAEDGVLKIDDSHEMISWGYANPTPWETAREQNELELLASITNLAESVTDMGNAIFNLHAPPFDTGLDLAPMLSKDLVPQSESGQVKMVPVGSKSIREVLENYQPMLGLHGHIHESAGFRKLGRTLVINPGSDHTTGALNGVLVTLEKNKLNGHQIVRG